MNMVRRRYLWTCIVCGVLLVGYASYYSYRSHLAWLYRSTVEPIKVAAIPNQALPVMAVPEDWERCQIRSIEFSLPPELSQGRWKDRKAYFSSEERSVRVDFLGTETKEQSVEGTKFLTDKFRLAYELRQGDRQPFTWYDFRCACNQINSDDFRWSMTSKEVRWHMLCVANFDIRLYQDGFTESFATEELMGVVHFSSDSAALYWQTNDRKSGGYIAFTGKFTGDEADLTWVRTVCRSLKLAR